MTRRHIGGEMELDLSAVGVHERLDRWKGALPGQTCLTSTGRSALAKILACILRADPSVRSFLLPAYLCQSVVRPFLAAGFAVHFYPLDGCLHIDPEALEQVASSVDARGILFINYFGRPIDADERQAIAELKRRVWVIEDCAMGGLLECGGDPIGATGHFAFTSLRKYLPVPDGAVIWNRSGLDLPDEQGEGDPPWVRLRVLGKLMRGEYLKLPTDDSSAELLETSYLHLFETSERMLDETGGARTPSSFSVPAGEYDLKALTCRRQQNYQHLDRLCRLRADDVGRRRPLYSALLPASSPLVFPFLCDNESERNALREHLRQRRVFCPIHWPLPDRVDSQSHPTAVLLSRSILGLPVDGRYGEADMQYCFEAVADFFRRGPLN